MNTIRRESCCELFKQLNILPLQSQYIYSSYSYLSEKIEICFYLTPELYSMVSVQDLTQIYTYLQLPSHYSRKVSSIQEVRFLITT